MCVWMRGKKGGLHCPLRCCSIIFVVSWVEFGFCICFHSGQRLLLLQCTGTHTDTNESAGNRHYLCCCVFVLLLCSPCTLPAKVSLPPSLSLTLLVYGRAMPEGQVRRCLRHVPNCPCRSLTFSQTFFYGCLVLFSILLRLCDQDKLLFHAIRHCQPLNFAAILIVETQKYSKYRYR